MAYNTVTVAGTAILLVAANPNRKSVVISNTSTSTAIYIGPDTSITTANAIQIPASSSFTEDSSGTMMYLGNIYGISGGSIDVRYWERTDNR